MAIIKQTETFLKRFGSIRPTSGGKGLKDLNILILINTYVNKNVLVHICINHVYSFETVVENSKGFTIFLFIKFNLPWNLNNNLLMFCLYQCFRPVMAIFFYLYRQMNLTML